MPKLMIDVPADVHEKLKIYAQEDERSLTKYIERGLKYLAQHPYHISYDIFNPVPAPISIPQTTTPYPVPQETYRVTCNGISNQNLPEGAITTIKYKTPSSPSPQQQKNLDLKNQKLELDLQLKQEKQKEKFKQFVLDQYQNICGWIPPAFDKNHPTYDPVSFDRFIELFPTEELMIERIKEIKKEEDYYYANLNTNTTEEKYNKYYTAVHDYYINNDIQLEELGTRNGDESFESLCYDCKDFNILGLKEIHQFFIFSALNIPRSHSWSDDEWLEFTKYILNPTQFTDE